MLIRRIVERQQTRYLNATIFVIVFEENIWLRGLTLLLDTFKKTVFIGSFSGNAVKPIFEQSTLAANTRCGPLRSCAYKKQKQIIKNLFLLSNLLFLVSNHQVVVLKEEFQHSRFLLLISTK